MHGPDESKCSAGIGSSCASHCCGELDDSSGRHGARETAALYLSAYGFTFWFKFLTCVVQVPVQVTTCHFCASLTPNTQPLSENPSTALGRKL